jgi:hypothetical protein
MRVLLAWLCIGLCAAPVAAQDARPVPLEVALNTTPIPPRDRLELARRLNGVTTIPAPPTTAPAYQIGDHAPFYVSNTSDDEIVQISARLTALSEHLAVWVQDDLAGRIDPAALRALAAAFDDEIYDAVRDLWGEEPSPGIDGDPRIHGLFTDQIGAGAAAYYMGDNTYPRAVVATSNEREMFYFNANTFLYYSPRDVESVVAHEFQHMIRRHVQINEETWMNEGFSTFTQTLLYGTSGSEIYVFLSHPNTQLNAWNEDVSARSANYGASNLFITYFYERYGAHALRELSANAAPRGLQAVDEVLRAMGEPGVELFFADWAVANRVLDHSAADGRYGYARVGTDPAWLQADTYDQYGTPYGGLVSQYGTRYLTLENPPDLLEIDVRLPRTVGVVPTQAASGSHFWYSNRADMSDTMLTRAFDLTGVAGATLEFALWYHLEAYWDFGHVMVSTDDGASWHILMSRSMTDQNPFNTAYGAGYTGMSGGGALQPEWVQERISLDAYTGQPILLRFEVITDDAINQPGLVIDDVRIPEIGYASDFEADDGGWTPDGFIWTDNTMPQRAWVQVIEREDDDVRVTRWMVPDDGTHFTLDLKADDITVALSGLAPVTTVPMPFQITFTDAAG